MTDLAVDPRVAETLARVEAATASLAGLLGTTHGGAPLDAGPADQQGSAEEVLPGTACTGVFVEAGDGSGDRLFLLVAAELDGEGGNPVPPTPLPALIESAARSVSMPIGAVGEIDDAAAAVAALGIAPGGVMLASGLFLGGGHVATVGIVLSPPPAAVEPEPAPIESEPVAAPAMSADTSAPLRLLADIEMAITAELGRARMTVAELLALTPGAVVELDRAAGAPVDLLVNGTLIARGEVVVVDERFAVRVTEIVGSGAGGSAR